MSDDGNTKQMPNKISVASPTKNVEESGNFSKHFIMITRQPEIGPIEKKKEKKNPPLLFNLAELQNECSKRFKISPDETLRIVQELYEKKLVTYPRTDARVLSTAVAKEITKNLNGLSKYPVAAPYMQRCQV